VTEYPFLQFAEMLGWALHEEIAFLHLEFIITCANLAERQGTRGAVAIGKATRLRPTTDHFRQTQPRAGNVRKCVFFARIVRHVILAGP